VSARILDALRIGGKAALADAIGVALLAFGLKLANAEDWFE
jgi:hypothetical protein